MKTKLVDFDIEKAKAGAVVKNKKGDIIRIICYDAKTVGYPIVGLCPNSALVEVVKQYNIYGEYVVEKDHKLDGHNVDGLIIEEQIYEKDDIWG